MMVRLSIEQSSQILFVRHALAPGLHVRRQHKAAVSGVVFPISRHRAALSAS